MNEKFTPGPWHAGKKDHPVGYFPIYARTGVTKISRIAKTDSHEVGFGISEAEQRANAKLIAAAPDLYAALKCLYDKLLMSDRDGQSHISEEEGEMALGALRKARGEA